MIDTTIEEFKKQKVEVIVSYDCYHDSFRNKMRKILTEEYQSKEINESNYKLGILLDFNGISGLKNKLTKLFNEEIGISEGKNDKRTVVKIITPTSVLQFNIEEIINHQH